jgi:hypothetical protein
VPFRLLAHTITGKLRYAIGCAGLFFGGVLIRVTFKSIGGYFSLAASLKNYDRGNLGL